LFCPDKDRPLALAQLMPRRARANVCLAESHWYRSVFIVPGGVFGAMVSDSKQ
jgi:hypothetical protein